MLYESEGRALAHRGGYEASDVLNLFDVIYTHNTSEVLYSLYRN
jgi:hypothetical protein